MHRRKLQAEPLQLSWWSTRSVGVRTWVQIPLEAVACAFPREHVFMHVFACTYMYISVPAVVPCDMLAQYAVTPNQVAPRRSPSAAGQCHARPPQPTQPARRVHARWAPHWVQPHVADILNTYVHARHRPARGHLAWAGTPACVRDHLICMESNKGRSGN